jgi:hypothetical protein
MDQQLAGIPVLGAWLSGSAAVFALAAFLLAIVALFVAVSARRAAARSGGRMYSTMSVTPTGAAGAGWRAAPALGLNAEARLNDLQRRLELLERSSDERPSAVVAVVPPGLATENQEPAPHRAPDVAARQTGIPVELSGGWIVLSESLSAPGLLLQPEDGGRARVFINEEMDLSNIVLENWSTVFDIGTGEPFRHYRTVRPAEVDWSAAARRGQPVSRGTLEVVQ